MLRKLVFRHCVYDKVQWKLLGEIRSCFIIFLAHLGYFLRVWKQRNKQNVWFPLSKIHIREWESMFCFKCRFDKVEGNKALCAKTNEYFKIFEKLLFIFPITLQFGMRLWGHRVASWGCLAILIKYEMCIVFICLAEIFIVGSSSGNPSLVYGLFLQKQNQTFELN